MNAQIVSIVIFFAVIIAIISEKIHRTVAALTGMILLLLFHILDIDKAISYIDFNTIGVLLGMMIFVSVVKQSGLFEYVAIKSAKLAQGDPLRIMLAFMILTAVLSAFLDNVTTVLLIGPMTITICQILKINPVPMLMTQILASNIGGTGTLIGDPPNIMIGSAAGLDFTDFLLHTGLVVLVILFFTAIIMRVLYKKDLVANQEEIQEILSLDEKKSDRRPCAFAQKFANVAAGCAWICFSRNARHRIRCGGSYCWRRNAAHWQTKRRTYHYGNGMGDDIIFLGTICCRRWNG